MSVNAVKESPASNDVKFVGREPKKSPKITFFGIFGIQNLGNECTLQAIAHNARERIRDVEIHAISYNPADTLTRHRLDAFRMSRQDFSKVRSNKLIRLFRLAFKRPIGELMDWAHAVKSLRGVHLVVMTGTGMLTDYSTTAFGFPYDVFRWALAARLAGCKVRFVGVGVGPIYQRVSRKFIQWALRAADYRSFRDEFSRNRIAKIFDSSSDHVFPDLAFSLPKSIFPERRNRGRKQQIGLGVMDHRDIHMTTQEEHDAGYSSYLQKMCEFVEWLLKHDYEVRILQGDARHDASTRAELRSRLEQRGIYYENVGVFDEGSSSVEELLDQLSHVDIVVSPRFHNLLLGMMMNIPAISISYDPKSDSLLETMGLGKYRQALEKLDVELLKQHFMEVQGRIDELKPMIAERAEECRRLLDEQYDLIFANL